MVKVFIMKEKETDNASVGLLIANTTYSKDNRFVSTNCHVYNLADDGYDEDGSPTGALYFAEVHFRFDRCTHWWFKGEGYNHGDNDSYYHLCETYNDHMDLMAFVGYVVQTHLLNDVQDNEDICYHKKLKLDEYYDIIECESQPEWLTSDFIIQNNIEFPQD